MRQPPDTVMLFAAGFGTRMAPLTDRMPKPLIPVAGRALVDHALALTDGFDRRVMNLHYRAGMLTAHLAGRGIHFSHEDEQILDTGGGLRHARPLLGPGPVATLNTDAVWAGPNPLDALRAGWRPATMDALLLTVSLGRALGRSGPGDFTVRQDGRLTRKGDQVYTGAQIVKTDRLAEIDDAAFSLNVLWDMFAQDNRLFGLEYDGRWCDVGHPDGIRIAEAMLADV